jgi:hypothetical protein
MKQHNLYICACRIIVICIFQIQTLISPAQVNVSGLIHNSTNNLAVPDVSIYLNNTKIGASSNASGYYQMKGVMPGVYEIIVSHIGYNMISKRVEVRSEDINLDFSIIPKIKELHNILVMTKDKRGEWLTIFRQSFLGTSFAADKTKILNESAVIFEAGATPGAIKAFSEQPLIIENKELGYRVHFDLVEFFYDSREMVTYFKGFSRFEEISTDAAALKRFEKNRLKYYYGSSQHFFHALLADDLVNQDFDVTLTVPFNEASAAKENEAAEGVVSKNKNGEKLVTHKVTRDEILFSAGSGAEKNYLYWKGQLQVRYRKDPYGKNRFQALGFQTGMLSSGVESGILMITSPVVLDKKGVLENPLSVQYTGYWSYERIATLLPMDFIPMLR